MEQKDALVILIRGIMLAQKRGAYELTEAEMLSKAIKCFSKENQEKNELLNNNPPKDTENSFII